MHFIHQAAALVGGIEECSRPYRGGVRKTRQTFGTSSKIVLYYICEQAGFPSLEQFGESVRTLSNVSGVAGSNWEPKL